MVRILATTLFAWIVIQGTDGAQPELARQGLPLSPMRPPAQPQTTPLQQQTPPSSTSESAAALTKVTLGILDGLGGPMALLTPVLKPLITEATHGVITVLKGVVTTLTKNDSYCNRFCQKAARTAATCGSTTGLGICKLRCQKEVQVSGYTLRIRFGNGWNLNKCIKYSVEKGLQTDEAKTAKARKDKSFAVYGQDNLDYAREMLTVRDVLTKFVDKGYLASGLPQEQFDPLAIKIKKEINDMDQRFQERMIEYGKQ